jgi:c-di-GMP phosphodiesterase
MATAETPASSVEASLHPWPGETLSLSRQPILDIRGRVHGYQLDFQIGSSAAPDDTHLADSAILDDIVLFGLHRLTGGLPAFVQCSAETITDRVVAVLPAATTVLELPANTEIAPRLIRACSDLRMAGFRLALTDYSWNPVPNPLLDLADYITVDFARLDAFARAQVRRQLEGASVAKIACQIHTHDTWRKASDEGFKLFQGFYFCNPELIEGARIPSNRRFHFEILRQLFRNPLDLKELCPLVLRDAALVYRVMRLVNSPLCAIRQQVNSIESAIVILGEVTFRRIATLAIECELNSKQPPEILHTTLIRARFCELAAAPTQLNPDEQYLLGMLSLLPAMLQLPMEAIVPELPLRSKIRQALLGTSVPERRLLDWVEAHERGNLKGCTAIEQTHNMNGQQLNKLYVDALVWDAAAPGLAA